MYIAEAPSYNLYRLEVINSCYQLIYNSFTLLSWFWKQKKSYETLRLAALVKRLAIKDEKTEYL